MIFYTTTLRAKESLHKILCVNFTLRMCENLHKHPGKCPGKCPGKGRKDDDDEHEPHFAQANVLLTGG